MFYVYLLQSVKDKELYIGSTNDLRKRVEEHNKGLVKSTRKRAPFKLIYYESYKAEEDAREREKQLKLRGQARAHLLSRLKSSLLQN